MLLRWNMLFFDFCVRYLRLFDCFNTGKTVLLEQCCRNDAKLALPKMRQVGVVIIALPNLQQVWFIYTKLAVSMAVQAILGAFLAALGNMIMPVRSSRFTLL